MWASNWWQRDTLKFISLIRRTSAVKLNALQSLSRRFYFLLENAKDSHECQIALFHWETERGIELATTEKNVINFSESHLKSNNEILCEKSNSNGKWCVQNDEHEFKYFIRYVLVPVLMLRVGEYVCVCEPRWKICNKSALHCIFDVFRIRLPHIIYTRCVFFSFLRALLCVIHLSLALASSPLSVNGTRHSHKTICKNIVHSSLSVCRFFFQLFSWIFFFVCCARSPFESQCAFSCRTVVGHKKKEQKAHFKEA